MQKPTGFFQKNMEIEFKSKNDKQIQAAEFWIDDVTEEILYGGAKGGGKSFLGASLIFGDALLYSGTHYFIARKELIDLRNFTIPTIQEVFKKWGLEIAKYAVYNGQDHCFNLYNGSKVYLIACKDEPGDPLFERFGSMQMTRGWIEEAGEVPENAKDNLWLSIGRWRNEEYGLAPKLLITANPKKGWMKTYFVEPFMKGVLPIARQYIQAFSSDNTYLPASYNAKLHADKNKVRRQRLAEGNWEYDDDADSLITYDSLSDAFSNAIIKDGEKYLTVDVARQGNDSTVMSFWDGLELYRVEQFEKQGTDVTEQKIKDFAAIERIPYSHIIIDEDGIGGGVVDHLQGVKGFTANSIPMPTGAVIRERRAKVQHSLIQKTVYANLKAQCGWKISELIVEHKVGIRVGEYRDIIIEELTAMLRDNAPDGDGKKQLISKADVKKELKRSPDVGDTILMRAYFELSKDSVGQDDKKLNEAMEEQSVRLRRNKHNSAARSSK